MNPYQHMLYKEDVDCVAKISIPWEKLCNRTIMISGATGLVGGFLVDVIMHKNNIDNMNCRIIALGRDEGKARQRFSDYFNNPLFCFFQHDVKNPILYSSSDRADYILHLASNTHPFLYATDPIGTITTNIIGLQNMLNYAVEHSTTRFAFSSSNEIYGENRGDTEFFDEHYCGYIDCNTLRAGYPESKRCGEALCQAYKAQRGLDVVIPRITRSYGPTISMSDTKAISQFLKNAIAGEDIVLKSSGTQFYSYTYMADAVSGLLTVLLCGISGEAYNISDEKSDITLKDLAKTIAEYSGTNVVFERPDSTESLGYSTATKARLSNNKISELGWRAKYDIRMGIKRTIDILKQ